MATGTFSVTGTSNSGRDGRTVGSSGFMSKNGSCVRGAGARGDVDAVVGAESATSLPRPSTRMLKKAGAGWGDPVVAVRATVLREQGFPLTFPRTLEARHADEDRARCRGPHVPDPRARPRRRA